MPRSPSVIILLAVLPACADDGPPEPPDQVVVQIAGQRAELLAARQEADAWQTLTADANGRTTFAVDRPFELVGACPDDGGEIFIYSGGPEDADDSSPDKFDIGCNPLASATVTVTTTNPTQLRVYIGSTFFRVSAGVDEQDTIVPGVHDIGILDAATGQLAIRRDVEIGDGATIAVDLTGAMALVERPVNTTPQEVPLNSWIRTANKTRISLAGAQPTGWSVPAALAVAGDRHFIAAVQSDAGTRGRHRTVEVTPGSTAPLAITLPPSLEGVSFTWDQAPAVTFDAGETWDQMTLWGFQSDADTAPMWYLHAFEHAARTPGALAMPASVTGIPGWNPAWNVDGLGPYYLELSMTRWTSDGSEGVTGWVNVPAQQQARARARRGLDEMRP